MDIPIVPQNVRYTLHVTTPENDRTVREWIEVGGGSLRIHDGKLQAKMFEVLGFTPEKASRDLCRSVSFATTAGICL